MSPAATPGGSAPPPADPRTLVGVDLRGIQRFVYEGRRLLDAVGRSVLVADLTDTDPANKDGISELFTGLGPHQVLRDMGGALVVAFADPADAHAFTGRYTRYLRDLSDLLEPVVAHVPVDPAERPGISPLAVAEERLAAALFRARRDGGAAHTPVFGYGVTALCDVTGRPAEAIDQRRERGDRYERVARDVVHARARARKWHRERSADLLGGARPRLPGRRLDLPMSVEHLGREMGDVSQQAVIHLDFNDLGKTLRRYREELVASGVDHLPPMRGVSQQVRALTGGLAKAMVTAVAGRLELVGADKPEAVIRGAGTEEVLRAHQSGTTVHVPLRPIVVAGDDLTVVCDARLAWSLTRFAFTWLDAAPDPEDPDDPRRPFVERLDEPWGRAALLRESDTETGVPTAGVGLVVQPVGAPLIAGYQVSEGLCELAKQHRTKWGKKDEHTVAWSLDFDTPDRVARRLTERHDATGRKLCAQPMFGTEFHGFLTTYLDPGEPGSLRGERWTEQRSWLFSDLVKLLHDGGDLLPELRRRASLGLPAALPATGTDREPDGEERARLLEAVNLLDTHLDVDLGGAPTTSPEGSAT